MTQFHQEKVRGQLTELAVRFFAREASNVSLMTITNTILSPDEKQALVCFTVLPEAEEAHALEFAKRKRTEFREFVKKESRIGIIPYFDFAIDLGEKNRQRVDELVS